MQGREQPARAQQQKAKHAKRQKRPCQHPIQAARIGRFESPETVVHPTCQAAAFFAAKKLGAEHWRQAECKKAGKGDRPDHGHRKLAEEQSRLARDEHHRHEYGADDERRRDDREADLTRAVERRSERRLPFLDTMIDILEHDDRVVDNDADGEHHREQRQEIDRKAHHPENGEARQQAERHRHCRDECCTPAPQEQEDHGNHEHRGFSQRHPNLVDRTADEKGFVRANGHLHALGKSGTDLLHHLLGRIGHCERVGAGLAHDPKPHRGSAIQPERRIGIFRTLLDPRDIAQANEVAVLGACDDQLPEFFGGGELPFDAQRDVLGLSFDTARRQFHILRPEAVFDVRWGNAEPRQALRLHPDAHRRTRLAADEHPGHAADRGESVDEVAIHIVAELETAPAWLRKDQEHDRRCIGIHFAHLRRHRFLREVLGCGSDPVPDVVGGAVDVPPRREFDRNVGAAVLRA